MKVIRGDSAYHQLLTEFSDTRQLFRLLMDTAKCLAKSQYSVTMLRKECLIPLVESRNIRELLRNSTPDAYLFGSKLESDMKKSKESEALFSSKRDTDNPRYRSENYGTHSTKGPGRIFRVFRLVSTKAALELSPFNQAPQRGPLHRFQTKRINQNN